MIEIIKNVEVGKYYLVPCLWVSKIKSQFHEFVPVIPFLHSDPQFGTENAKKKHFHFDCRFLNSEVRLYFDVFNNRTMRVLTIDILESVVLHHVLMQCVSTETGLESNLTAGRLMPEQTKTWYKSQIGKSCAGKKCPHYGVEMLENGDFLECPLHGLIGSQKSNKIIGNIHQGITDFLGEISGKDEVYL